MKFILVMFFLLGSVTGAAAQYGVSNARDGSGNLIRDRGVSSTRTFDQSPVNNVINSVNRSAPTADQGRRKGRK
jgi:hypothetical protein